jgi:hypothetical protein
MSKRSPKKLRPDERKRRAEQRATSRVSSCFDRRELEAFVAMGDRALLALEILAHHCPGIAQRDLDAAASTVLETAADEGLDPAEVALHLLALRDVSAAERERVMPDPVQRAPLAGFFASHGPSAAPLLAALKGVHAEAARFSRLSAAEQEATLRAQEAHRRVRAGEGAVAGGASGPGVRNVCEVALTKTRTSAA